jgi:hypothetical protein
MAPAAISHFPVGAHSVFWTWAGEQYRCVGCQSVRTMEQFETKPECVT